MSNNNLLQRGNIVEIKEGMEVYAKIEERFLVKHYPLSKVKVKTLITVGDVLKTSSFEETKLVLGNYISAFFLGKHLSHLKNEQNQIVDMFMNKYKDEVYDTHLYAGNYVVINTNIDWVFNSYEVILKKLNNDRVYDPASLEISIFQSSKCRDISVIKDIELIGELFSFEA